MSEKTTQDAINEVWQLFKETDARLDRRIAETDARLDKRIEETDARLDKRSAVTEANLTRLENLFTSQWGKMLEALVEPGALALFQSRGIDLKRTYRRSESQLNGRTMELDVVLEDSTDIVVVEVKSTLKVADVQEFLVDLGEVLDFFPRFRGFNIYGAVAGLTIEENADRFAYRQGLFVLGVTGEGVVSIKNDEAFQPANFG